jgi:hypothetical protein
VALGALGLSQTTRRNTNDVRRLKIEHESFAMIKYGQALAHMQEVVNDQNVDTRQILLISLLVFCFEAMQGRKDTACINAARGLRAVTNLHLETSQRKSTGESRMSPYAESIYDEGMLDKQSNNPFCNVNVMTFGQ